MYNEFTLMQTTQQLRVSDRVQQAVNKGFSVTGISNLLGISRPTYYKRLQDNSWTDEEIRTLKDQRVIL